jgi:hypothetical protein
LVVVNLLELCEPAGPLEVGRLGAYRGGSSAPASSGYRFEVETPNLSMRPIWADGCVDIVVCGTYFPFFSRPRLYGTRLWKLRSEKLSVVGRLVRQVLTNGVLLRVLVMVLIRASTSELHPPVSTVASKNNNQRVRMSTRLLKNSRPCKGHTNSR